MSIETQKPIIDDFFSYLEENEMMTESSSSKKSKTEDMFQMFEEFETESEEEEREEDVRVESHVGHQRAKKEDEAPCVRCGSIGTLYNDNENMVCTSCGCDNGMILDTNPEWRFYGSDDNRKSADPNRCGMPINPYIKNSSLSIAILGKGFETYRKVNTWNGMSYKERSLMTILNMVMNKANIENVPQSIIDRTIFMYQTVCTEHVKRGTSRESLIAACFSQAMRESGYLRSHQEVAKLFNIKAKKLSKGYNEFTELLYKSNKEDYVQKIKPIDSKDLILNYCQYLEFTEQQKKSCLMALYGVERMGLCQENNPKSIAVGVMYLIAEHYGLEYTKRDIAEYCKTSEVTVSSTYSQMIKFVRYLIPGRT